MKTKANPLCVINGQDLMDMELAMTKFCVKGLLPQGLCILGGAPKIGKSWLVLDLCVRIAKGEAMWDMAVSTSSASGRRRKVSCDLPATISPGS